MREDRPGKMARHYLEGWFLIDFLSCLPVGYIGYILNAGKSQENKDEQDSNARMVKAFRLIRLSRMLRLARSAPARRRCVGLSVLHSESVFNQSIGSVWARKALNGPFGMGLGPGRIKKILSKYSGNVHLQTYLNIGFTVRVRPCVSARGAPCVCGPAGGW